MEDSIAIVSGGMDSVTMLYYMVKELHLRPLSVTFLYGQRHRKEIVFAKYHSAALGCDNILIDFSFLNQLFDSSSLVSTAIDIPNTNDVSATRNHRPMFQTEI